MFIFHWYGLFLALEIYFSGLESTFMQITFAMLLVLLFSDFQSPVNLLSSTLLTVNTSKASSRCESDTPLDKTSSEIVDCIFLGSNNSSKQHRVMHKQVSFCSPWAIPPVVFYTLFKGNYVFVRREICAFFNAPSLKIHHKIQCNPSFYIHHTSCLWFIKTKSITLICTHTTDARPYFCFFCACVITQALVIINVSVNANGSFLQNK